MSTELLVAEDSELDAIGDVGLAVVFRAFWLSFSFWRAAAGAGAGGACWAAEASTTAGVESGVPGGILGH